MRKTVAFAAIICLVYLSFQATALNLNVQVNDSEGGLLNATVTVYNSSFSTNNLTNSTGGVNFDLNASNYTINVTKPGYILNSTAIELLTNYTHNVTLAANTTPPVFNFTTISSRYLKNNTALNVTISTDEVLNQTPTLLVNGSQAINSSNTTLNYNFYYIINDSVLAEGNITLNISGYDVYGNYGSNTTTAVIDYTSPTINTASLSDNYTQNNTIVNISVNVTDLNNISTVLANSIELTYNNGLHTGSINLSGQDITIIANDTAGNQVNTSINYTIDSTAPSLTVVTPTSNVETNFTNTTFNWTAYDSQQASINCSVYINNSINYTVIGNNSFQTNISLSSGVHPFKIVCLDDANNTVTSTEKTAYVDLNHNPELSASLSDNYTQNNTAVTLYLNITSYSNITEANYSIGNTTGDLSLSSGTTYEGTWTASLTLSDNATNITINVSDYYNDTSTFTVNYTVDDTKPTTNVSGLTVTPQNNGALEITWTNDNSNDYHRIYKRASNTITGTISSYYYTTVNPGLELYVDNTTTSGTNYYYAVVTMDQADNYNESIYIVANATASDSEVPRNPTSLNATTLSNNAIKLEWDEVTLSVDGNPEPGTITYLIYRNTTNNLTITGSAVPTYSTTNTEINDTYEGIFGEVGNQTFYYTVIVNDTAGNMNTSTVNTANASTLAECENDFTYSSWKSCLSTGYQYRDGERECYGFDFVDDIEEIEGNRTCTPTSATTEDNKKSSEDSGEQSTTTVIASLLSVWTSLSTDSSKLTFTDEKYGLESIEFKPTAEAKNVKIRITAHNGKPDSAETAFEYPYFLYLELDDLGFTFKEVKFKFFVTFEWLNEQDVFRDDITLWHYNVKTDAYDKVETTEVTEDARKVYYEATATEFSTYVIGKATPPIIPEVIEEIVNDAEDENNDTDANTLTGAATKNLVEQADKELPEEKSYEGLKTAGVTSLIILGIIIALIGGTLIFLMYYDPKLYDKLMTQVDAKKEEVSKKIKDKIEAQKDIKIAKAMAADKKSKSTPAPAPKLEEPAEDEDHELTEEEALKQYAKRDRILRF